MSQVRETRGNALRDSDEDVCSEYGERAPDTKAGTKVGTGVKGQVGSVSDEVYLRSVFSSSERGRVETREPRYTRRRTIGNSSINCHSHLKLI